MGEAIVVVALIAISLSSVVTSILTYKTIRTEQDTRNNLVQYYHLHIQRLHETQREEIHNLLARAAQERRELEDRLMVLCEPERFQIHKATSDDAPVGEVEVPDSFDTDLIGVTDGSPTFE